MTYLVSNPKYKRRKSKKIHIDSVSIGGDSPITVQSMTTTDTRDVKTTLEQIAAELGLPIMTEEEIEELCERINTDRREKPATSQ